MKKFKATHRTIFREEVSIISVNFPMIFVQDAKGRTMDVHADKLYNMKTGESYFDENPQED